MFACLASQSIKKAQKKQVLKVSFNNVGVTGEEEIAYRFSLRHGLSG